MDKTIYIPCIYCDGTGHAGPDNVITRTLNLLATHGESNALRLAQLDNCRRDTMNIRLSRMHARGLVTRRVEGRKVFYKAKGAG